MTFGEKRGGPINPTPAPLSKKAVKNSQTVIYNNFQINTLNPNHHYVTCIR